MTMRWRPRSWRKAYACSARMRSSSSNWSRPSCKNCCRRHPAHYHHRGRSSFQSAGLFIFTGVRMKHWLFLGTAIISEVIATSALKASDGFSRLWPSMIVVLGYAVSFYFLSLTLKTLPVGIAYAIWSGLGIVLISVIGILLFGQKLDGPAIIGMGLIIAGVVVMNVFSKTVA